jgi:hypothetical protein
MRTQSNFNTLCRGFLVPKEIRDKETVQKFLEAVGQFERIVNDSGFVRLTRLTSYEITGTKEHLLSNDVFLYDDPKIVKPVALFEGF